MPLLPDLSIGALPGEDPKKQLESLVKQLNEWGRLISNEERTKIIRDDSGTPRILNGFQEGGFVNNIGMKISAPGKDVLTASPDELIFNSDNNVFKIVSTGTFDWQPTAGGTGFSSYTLAHNLGFAPIPMVYVTDGTYYYPLPRATNKSISGGAVSFQDYFDCSVDSTNLYINNSTALSDPRPTRTFRYYLLQETAS